MGVNKGVGVGKGIEIENKWDGGKDPHKPQTYKSEMWQDRGNQPHTGILTHLTGEPSGTW